MAVTQTAFDLNDNEPKHNNNLDSEDGLHEQQTAALLTQLQINSQQVNEQEILKADEETEPDDPHRGRHHGTRRVLDINLIYMEPQVEEYERGREILAKFPDAKRIHIASHWNNPELNQNEELVSDWVKVKRSTLVLGVKKSLSCMPYERSCDFVAPSHANGCSLACSYCVARGTLISTPRGPMPVEQIRDADAVFAFDSSLGRLVPGFVSGTACREVDEALEIQVDGTTLRVTAEHPIMTRRGWVKAGELAETEDDEVLCDTLTYKAISSIRLVKTHETVYNFHVPGAESYVANGIITHNCYVGRRKGSANPITTFVNIEQICGFMERHAKRQGEKMTPTQADPHLWTYELGTNSDCSLDALVSDNIKDLVALFRRIPNAKGTFATKYVNREMLAYDPQGKTRCRFSLMPPAIAKILDVRTSKMSDRIGAINDFVEAGYEVNVNFAPVVVYDGWLEAYADLFVMLDDSLSERARAQMTAEIAFLTHNEELHEVNLGWHPKGEDILWRPDIQETKISGTGGRNLRYKVSLKRQWVAQFTALLHQKLPYCAIRYAF